PVAPRLYSLSLHDALPISVGLGEIKAAVFEHAGKPLYSFNFSSEKDDMFTDYFDEEANNLRRAFLKAPVEFSRISSRYNLNRRRSEEHTSELQSRFDLVCR